MQLPHLGVSPRARPDPPRTRTWNLRLRRPTPYPLGQQALCAFEGAALLKQWRRQTTTMTSAGLEPAIPGSVGRCLIHWATGPWGAQKTFDKSKFPMRKAWPRIKRILVAARARLHSWYLADAVEREFSILKRVLPRHGNALPRSANHLVEFAETRGRAGALQIFSLTLSQLSYRGCVFCVEQAWDI